jgi:hypothetical protein
MKRITVLALALLIPATLATRGAPIPALQPYVSWELVGFTEAEVPPDTGVLAMTAACHAEYAGAKFCASEQVLATNAIYLDGTEANAWVQPSYRPFQMHVSATNYPTPFNATLDASGVMADGQNGVSEPPSMTCSGWSRTDVATGLTVSASGQFKSATCWEVTRPIRRFLGAPTATPATPPLLLPPHQRATPA